VRQMMLVRYLGTLAMVFLIVGSAAAAETSGEAKAEAKPELTPEQHHAKGRVLYDGKWVHIETLFKDYRRARYELAYAEKRGGSAKDQLAGLHREMTVMKNETRQAERPIRMELGKARNELRTHNRNLKKRPPTKPTLRQPPDRPRRPSNTSSNRSSSGYGSSNNRSSSDNRYDNQMRQWRQAADAIRSENEAKVKLYQQQLKIYQQEQAAAKAATPKLEATIKQSLAKLDETEADLKQKQAPSRQRSDSTTETVLAHNRRVSVIENRVKQMTAALRAVPEGLRAKHGIVEFETVFYSSAELRATHQKTQSEIDRVRDQLKAESQKAGIPFPEQWRHPQQDRMDAIKALLAAAAAKKT